MRGWYRNGRFPRVFSRPGFSALLILLFSSIIAPDVHTATLKERRAGVSYSVNLNAPADAKVVRLWLPYSMSDENQEITDVVVTGNQTTSGVYNEGAFGNAALYTEWKDTKGPRTLTYTFKVHRRERVTKDFPKAELPFSKTEYRKELAPTRLANLQGPEKELAGKITVGKNTTMRRRSPSTTGSWRTCSGTRTPRDAASGKWTR